MSGGAAAGAVQPLSIIVPTFNESANIGELVRRIDASVRADPQLSRVAVEVLFVDDSTDDTPQQIDAAGAAAAVPVRCVQRSDRSGGLGGAVLVGAQQAAHDLCLVLDGDLQHPPEDIPKLYRRMLAGDTDVVIASRYAGTGNANGLATALRHGVSYAANLLTKAMFPIRLHDCTDPMTGFFLFDRRRVELDGLKPQGFKILLEMLARQPLRIAEVSFEFAKRHAGESKATLRQGAHFLRQLVQLRFGRMSRFAIIGALGALVNIAIVWLLTGAGASTFIATLTAAEVTIIGNFLLQDHFVFGDLRSRARGFWQRFARSFAFNNIEAALRIALVVLLVRQEVMGATLATAILLALAFLVRYVFHALVVYAPRSREKGEPPQEANESF